MNHQRNLKTSLLENGMKLFWSKNGDSVEIVSGHFPVVCIDCELAWPVAVLMQIAQIHLNGIQKHFFSQCCIQAWVIEQTLESSTLLRLAC